MIPQNKLFQVSIFVDRKNKWVVYEVLNWEQKERIETMCIKNSLKFITSEVLK